MKQQFQVGDVLYVVGACLPPLLIISFCEKGEYGDDLPTYITRALQPLSDFTEHDKEVGLPGCYYLRGSEWLSRDQILEMQGDLVVTGRVVRLCVADQKEFEGGVELTGRIAATVVEEKIEWKLFDDAFRDNPLTEEDRVPRDNFFEAIDLAMADFQETLSS
jgi:hypothetical protein